MKDHKIAWNIFQKYKYAYTPSTWIGALTSRHCKQTLTHASLAIICSELQFASISVKIMWKHRGVDCKLHENPDIFRNFWTFLIYTPAPALYFLFLSFRIKSSEKWKLEKGKTQSNKLQSCLFALVCACYRRMVACIFNRWLHSHFSSLTRAVFTPSISSILSVRTSIMLTAQQCI